MTAIIRYYLSRTRDTVHQYQQVNINSLVQETVSLLTPVFQHNHVSVQTYLAEELPLVKGESPSLQRVLINVLNNAVDAIDGEGNISVSTRLTVAGATAQPGVIIEVSDTGKGISPELLPQIFDLFMTTKASGKGTGLGLAISQEIIKSHGGSISVTSQPGAGTCVQVVLPAAEEHHAATQLGSEI
jgi:two-component system NtrC family sensor kinase